MRTMSLSIPPQGSSIVQGWSERTPYTTLVSHPYHDPPPLSEGEAVGWTCRSQLRVSASNSPQETRTQDRLCTQDNVPSSGVSSYMRVPITSFAECRHLLTMHRLCDMDGKPCSPSYPNS